MTRKQGTFGGNQSGGPRISSLRSRRQAQKAASDSGDRLGAGLVRDENGKIAIDQLNRIDPNDPLALPKLIKALQDSGIMKR